MGRKKIGLAAMAALALALCVSVLLLTTYALFSDTVETDNHLSAGTLKIGLYQTSMTGNQIDTGGTFGDYSESIPSGGRDLKTYDGKVFNIENACPGIYREAAFEVRNGGISTAFGLTLEIVNAAADVQGDAASSALLSQMRITVSWGTDGSETFLLSEEEKTVDLGTVTLPENMAENAVLSSFKVKAEFLNTAENNGAQGGSVSFDIRVTATQVTPSA